MTNEILTLNGNPKTTLTTYILDAYVYGQQRPMVVVCPGGGYLDCSPNEGECVALHFNRAGYHAAVLTYSTQASAPGNCAYPQPMLDLAEAICLIRTHADKWGIDTNKIAILGFSAGGHLCALYGNSWNTGSFSEIAPPEKIKPDAVILCYAAIDMEYHHSQMKSMWSQSADMQQVLGGSSRSVQIQQFFQTSEKALFGHYPPTREEIVAVDPLRHINENTPPTFIWHTFGDHLLSPLQSLHYAEALHKTGIPCELHIFDKGEHGISLGDKTSAKKPGGVDFHLANWGKLALEWLERLYE